MDSVKTKSHPTLLQNVNRNIRVACGSKHTTVIKCLSLNTNVNMMQYSEPGTKDSCINNPNND